MSPDDESFQQIDDKPNGINNAPVQKNSLTRPVQIYSIPDEKNVRVLCMVFNNNTLIVGTNAGKVFGFSWYKNRLAKKQWEVFIASKIWADSNDINTLYFQQNDNILYAGCGDNNVYAIDIGNDGKIVRTFKGHTDYIHCLDGSADQAIYSASEDGFIRFYDTRTARCTNQLQPHKDKQLARPDFGKWQGAVAVSNNWLICGGGPKACLYHLRSLDCSVVFDFKSTVHVTGFLDDTIYVGGDDKHLCQYNLKGDIRTQIPVSSTSIYSVISQSAPEKLLSIAGSSNNLDICTDYSFRDIVLQLYDSPNRQ